jgi:hypothetical protein
VLINTLTNPVAAFAMLLLLGTANSTHPYYLGSRRPGAALAVELGVALVEAELLRWVLGWSRCRALLVSLLSNALSLFLGPLVTTCLRALVAHLLGGAAGSLLDERFIPVGY